MLQEWELWAEPSRRWGGSSSGVLCSCERCSPRRCLEKPSLHEARGEPASVQVGFVPLPCQQGCQDAPRMPQPPTARPPAAGHLPPSLPNVHCCRQTLFYEIWF